MAKPKNGIKLSEIPKSFLMKVYVWIIRKGEHINSKLIRHVYLWIYGITMIEEEHTKK